MMQLSLLPILFINSLRSMKFTMWKRFVFFRSNRIIFNLIPENKNFARGSKVLLFEETVQAKLPSNYNL